MTVSLSWSHRPSSSHPPLPLKEAPVHDRSGDFELGISPSRSMERDYDEEHHLSLQWTPRRKAGRHGRS